MIEKAAKQDFLEVMKKLFKDLGLKNTCADFNEKIIHHRARYDNADAIRKKRVFFVKV